MGVLNLSGADLSGFEPLEAGRYNAEIFEITWDAVKNATGEGKTPAGTPMMKIQFKLLGEDPNGNSVDNRRVWQQFVVPPADYDKAKASKMKGMIARFFINMGDPEDVVLSKSFDPDFESYKGRPCVLVIGKEEKKIGGVVQVGEYNNPVKGVKPAGALVTSGSGLL